MINRRFLGIVVILSLSAGGGYFFWQKPKNTDTQRNTTVTVSLGNIEENVTAQGKLEPKEYVDVGAQVTGQLQKIYVKIGDNVSAGDLLAQIDPRIYEARVQADEANIKNLQSQLIGQRAEMVFAQQQYDRNKELLKTHSVSEQDFQNSEYTLKKAQATVGAIEAQIEQVQSTLNGDRTNLGYTKIYASMDGTVVDQKARAGQTLNANQQTPMILQLAKLDLMTVRAQVAEADVMRLKADLPVYFSTLGAGERRWKGTVRQILPTPQVVNNVVLYDVLIDVDNEDRQLMSGMSAQIFFVLGNAENVSLLPVTALGERLPKQDNEKGAAYRIKEITATGTEEKIVYVGLKNRRVVEIRDGVSVGSTVQIQSKGDDKNSRKDRPNFGAKL